MPDLSDMFLFVILIPSELELCRRQLIFPEGRPSSIVSADELNYRVRNGNGWNLIAIITGQLEAGHNRASSAMRTQALVPDYKSSGNT